MTMDSNTIKSLVFLGNNEKEVDWDNVYPELQLNRSLIHILVKSYGNYMSPNGNIFFIDTNHASTDKIYLGHKRKIRDYIINNILFG